MSADPSSSSCKKHLQFRQRQEHRQKTVAVLGWAPWRGWKMVGFWADGNGANKKGHANELAVGRAGETWRSPRLVAKRMDSVSPEMVTPTVKGGLQEREWPGGWVGVPLGWWS